MDVQHLYTEALQLLRQLISIPSFSREEDKTADAIEAFLIKNEVQPKRYINNLWAVNKLFDPSKPSLLLNSHHDTVKPNPQYTKDPFTPIEENGKLFGLGSNDAGGCLVSLIATFLYFFSKENLPYNIVLAVSAEEEISGLNGIEALLNCEEFIASTAGAFEAPFNGSVGIVGEPTLMNLAIAEKGLMVLDGFAHGKAGHAAREEGENAIYKALKDIEWISSYQFAKVSEWLGPVKMSVTVIETENKAHNMVPAVCRFVVDVRITEEYTHEEVLATIQQHTTSEIKPRSMRMRATGISPDHPLVKAGMALGKTCYGSPTGSDKAFMAFPTLKCGPGDSARSHSADEFIYLHEIENGIKEYIAIVEGFMQQA